MILSRTPIATNGQVKSANSGHRGSFCQLLRSVCSTGRARQPATVYVEKPPTSCISEGRKMIEAGKKCDRVVQNGMQMRARTGRREAIKLLREGLLGEIYMVRIKGPGVFKSSRGLSPSIA